MKAQFNVKSTVEWAIDYTTVLWHTNPTELLITTPSLNLVFVGIFLLRYSDFLNWTQEEMLREILVLKWMKDNDFQIDLSLKT